MSAEKLKSVAAASIAEKLKSMNITLPEAAAPAANYVPYAISGKIVFVSGQLPMEGGQPQFIGTVGKEFDIETGKKAARLCLLNVLAHLQAACGGNLDKVVRCIKLGVFVRSEDGFTDQPQVANGASDLVVEIFGDKGKHARFAVGVNGLPRGVAVEVEGTFEIA